jgi:hypothetical protein
LYRQTIFCTTRTRTPKDKEMMEKQDFINKENCSHQLKQGYHAEDFCVYCVKCDLTLNGIILKT